MSTCRRRLLVCLLGFPLSFLIFAPSLRAQQTSGTSQPIQFTWRVPQAHIDNVRTRFVYDGTLELERDAKGLPVVWILAGVALLPHLVDAIIELRREIVHGGVVIDTRGNTLSIDNDKELDAGIIVILSDGGAEIYERDQLTSPSELLSAIRPK